MENLLATGCSGSRLVSPRTRGDELAATARTLGCKLCDSLARGVT